ncbi:hypothetical protein N7G274_009663 [Stereocaulon virgatum]|uniref:Apple domain-containing protein n=1 Tax=Stereocaulon virgatum TaxID=373712 RepID=A0ABR3ZXW8_9LECA
MRTSPIVVIVSLTQSLCTLAQSPTAGCFGFANTAVPVPQSNTNTSQLLIPIASGHMLFLDSQDTTFPSQAALATYCLEKCVAYQGNSACLSVGLRMSATGNFCTAFDVELGAKDFIPVKQDGTEQHGLGVNRVCGGTFRAY